MAAASGAYDAAGAANGAAQDLAAGKMPDAKMELSWGSSSSQSTFTQDSSNDTGSTVKAGGTAAFVATGGNVDIAGSDVNASNVILSAANQVNLTNSTDTDSTRSTNESKSAGVGVSVGTGGIGVDASMSKAHGNANSDSTASNNTHINAANNATIISGGDTNLIGANVNGKSVSMDVGGNLNIASTQDTSTSAAKQDSTGGGIAISAGGASGSFNHSSGHANGNYAGVTEQTGIHAGTDGFAINVHGNTDLKGSVIASDATPDKNTLTTGTLTFSDIQNSSSYDAKSSGFGGGASTGNGGNTYATHGNTSGSNTGGIAPMLSQNDSGSDGATTRSAVSAGTITVTDQANQTQDVASLSRNTSNTNGTVTRNPDLNNVLDKQSDMMAATSAAGEAVARRIGDYADAQAKATGDPAWAEGGAARAEMQAAGAALVGGLGGGVASAAGSAAGAGLASISASRLNALSDSIANSSPTGNADIDRTLGNIVANVIATGAGAAVGGGAGATSAANVDHYNRQLHPEEKQWIKTNAAAYAKQNGITVDQAVSALTAQADRQVQSGSSGAWDQSASAFLSQAHGMLPADGNSGPGYMFYATPDQKANLNMYAGYYPKGAGLNKPAAADIAGSATHDAASRDVLSKQTWGAAAAAGGLALAGPVAGLPGAPIFSSGGALGSGTWASSAGTGAISASITAGSQYYQNGSINPIDVAIAAISGGVGVYGGLGWNIAVNALGGATGTGINNAVYGKNDSIMFNGATSGAFSSIGYGAGAITANTINSIMRPTLNNAGSWVSTGAWSGSGYNVLNPDNTAVIGGGITGGTLQEFVQGAINRAQQTGSKK